MHGRGTLTTGDGGVHTGQFRKGLIILITTGRGTMSHTYTYYNLTRAAEHVHRNIRVKKAI